MGESKESKWNVGVETVEEVCTEREEKEKKAIEEGTEREWRVFEERRVKNEREGFGERRVMKKWVGFGERRVKKKREGFGEGE